MTPLITTILPTYRRPEMLRLCLSRLLQQGDSRFKVMVLDNASGDETENVVSEATKVDSRVHYVLQPKHVGVLENYAFGFSLVDTPFFSLLGDDDFLQPDFYEKCLGAFQEDPELAFVGGRALVVRESGDPVLLMPGLSTKPGYYKPPRGIFSMFSGNLINHLAITGFLFRTDKIRELGFWKIENDYPADIDLLLRLAVKNSYRLYDDIVLIALMPGERHKPPLPLWKGWLRVYREFLANDEVPDEVRANAAAKFRAQLKRAFLKIWFRSVSVGNWENAYLLADILGEELGYIILGKILFSSSQFFRKNPKSPRLQRLNENLGQINRKQQSLINARSVGLWESLQDSIKEAR